MFRTLMTTAIVLSLSLAAFGGTNVGEPAPGFELKDQHGNTVTLDQFDGKIVVLEWFNEGCPVTKRHHSDKYKTMSNLAHQYKGKDVVWLAVNSSRDADVSSNAKAAQRFGVTYPILDDSAGKVGKAYGARTTPHMFIIDSSGVLAYDGAIDSDPRGGSSDATNYVAKALDELLAGKPVSTTNTKPYGCGVKYAK